MENKRFCANCGSEVTFSDVFCPNCGEKLDEVEQSETLVENAKVDKEESVAKEPKKKSNTGLIVAIIVIAALIVGGLFLLLNKGEDKPEKRGVGSVEILCPECGYEVDEEDVVCPNCGYTLKEEEQEEEEEDIDDEDDFDDEDETGAIETKSNDIYSGIEAKIIKAIKKAYPQIAEECPYQEYEIDYGDGSGAMYSWSVEDYGDYYYVTIGRGGWSSLTGSKGLDFEAEVRVDGDSYDITEITSAF